VLGLLVLVLPVLVLLVLGLLVLMRLNGLTRPVRFHASAR
jgi:hypothetical protein